MTGPSSPNVPSRARLNRASALVKAAFESGGCGCADAAARRNHIATRHAPARDRIIRTVGEATLRQPASPVYAASGMPLSRVSYADLVSLKLRTKEETSRLKTRHIVHNRNALQLPTHRSGR